MFWALSFLVLCFGVLCASLCVLVCLSYFEKNFWLWPCWKFGLKSATLTWNFSPMPIIGKFSLLLYPTISANSLSLFLFKIFSFLCFDGPIPLLYILASIFHLLLVPLNCSGICLFYWVIDFFTSIFPFKFEFCSIFLCL